MPILKGVVSANVALVDRHVVIFVEIVAVVIVISSTSTKQLTSLPKEKF